MTNLALPLCVWQQEKVAKQFGIKRTDLNRATKSPDRVIKIYNGRQGKYRLMIKD